MKDKIFLDTNVLVYLYDSDTPEKQARARSVLEQGIEHFQIVISTQVFQEFYVTATKKLSRHLSDGEMLLAMRGLQSLRRHQSWKKISTFFLGCSHHPSRSRRWL